MAHMTIAGTKALDRKLEQWAKEMPDVLTGALYVEGFEIFRESQELAPVDTGRLRASGVMGESNSEEGTIIIGYGVNYAAAAHEKSSSPGYLERPFLARLPQLGQNVARHVRSHLQGNFGFARQAGGVFSNVRGEKMDNE